MTSDLITPHGRDPATLSIIIKTLNEEEKISRAIESSLRCRDEVMPLKLEVVVADSASTDRTVEVASRYPVRVVRLNDPADRGCGTGVQLGYAWSQGDFVYVMDGDMELIPGFLSAAIRILNGEPDMGGVGGLVVDREIRNMIDRLRVNNRDGSKSGVRLWLEGGGLYTRKAIVAAGGYAADRYLLGYEEADLGLRITYAGYRLVRLNQPAVLHDGHALGTRDLMVRHWRSRRLMSAGVLLRKSMTHPWRWRVVQMMLHPLIVALWWMLLLASALASPSWQLEMIWASVSALGFGALCLVKRDIAHASFSIASWHISLAAIVLGWLQRRGNPLTPIAATLMHGHIQAPSETPP